MLMLVAARIAVMVGVLILVSLLAGSIQIRKPQPLPAIGTTTEQARISQAFDSTLPFAPKQNKHPKTKSEPQPIQSAAKLEPKPVPPNCTQVQCVALTFDDGPSPFTSRLLDYLKKEKTKTTFFMLGVYVERHASTVRQAVAEGHQIGNHTWMHHNLTKMTDAEVLSEIERTNSIVKRVAGVAPHIMRPPFGATDKRVADLAKLPQILWNVDSYDWRDKDAKLVADRVISAIKPGAIVLMHDIYPSSVDAVQIIVPALRDKGYHFVTINELYGKPPKPGNYWGQHETAIY